MTEEARPPVAARAAPILAEAPYRVVSLAPSVTESLVDLGLADRLIAVTDACTQPPGALDHLLRLGDPAAPDCARVIALQPDLVFISDEFNHPADAETLRQAGLMLWVTGPRSVFEMLNLLWDLMHAFDHTAMVPRVQAIERAYDATRSAAEAVSPARVFAATGRDSWCTFARDTYADDLLRVCGGENVFAGWTEPVVTLADILAVQPEVVLLPDEPDAAYEDDAALLAALDIPAARDNRIHRIDMTLLTWAGTRAAYALRDLPGLLMPGSG